MKIAFFKSKTMKLLFKLSVVLTLALFRPSVCKAYSVLTHEALIDAAWDKFFVPLLKAKFPQLQDSALKNLHAYAYGGAVSPDMGYYPFGSVLYTNLVHYVRSGDFVEALLTEAKSPEEYSFALGALCHYYADVYGHSIGVNKSVPVEYPKDKTKFGNLVTYEDDKAAHKRVEFAFDVSETAKGNYASQAYHDFIGFKVCNSVLDRALYKTYSLHLTDLFKNFSRAVNTFRWAVKEFFPLLIKAAWATKGDQLRKKDSTLTAQKFYYAMKRADYNKEFGRERDKPKLFSFLLSGLIRVLPKVGPLKPLKFKAPTAEVEKLFIQSFDTVEYFYSRTLQNLKQSVVSLENKDLDTGYDTKRGEYTLTDETYTQLLLTHAGNNFASASAELKKHMLSFFSRGDSGAKKTNRKEEEKIKTALANLRASHTAETKSK